MSLFRIEDRKTIVRIESTTFEANRMEERKHLQKMLKSQIEVIAPNILIVAEEFRPRLSDTAADWATGTVE